MQTKQYWTDAICFTTIAKTTGVCFSPSVVVVVVGWGMTVSGTITWHDNLGQVRSSLLTYVLQTLVQSLTCLNILGLNPCMLVTWWHNHLANIFVSYPTTNEAEVTPGMYTKNSIQETLF